ncbi:MAG TPA: hypothetical protein VGM47_05875 [Gammaproteobacteria bacterium]|jgi:hypothetical protein
MRLRIVMGSLACLLLGAAIAADEPADVRDLMSASQFHATGLDTLNPQQLAALNAWLASYTHTATTTSETFPVVAESVSPAPAPTAPAPAAPVPAPAASSVSSFGKEMLSGEVRGEPKRIESSIVGRFTGWTGNTVFKLANGQVWQQADDTTYDANLQDPQVVIKRLGTGYLLTLPGHGATVFVKRLQ